MTIFLETKRLILKPPSQSDLDDLLALRSDPAVMRYIIGDTKPHPKEKVQRFLQMAMTYQARHGFSFGSVFEKATGDFVGQAGLFHLGFEESQNEIELAYRLHKKYWGKGYATELARALLAWGFANLDVTRIVALIDPENIASRRVLEKAGMTYTGKVLYGKKEVPCYEIYRQDAIELVPYDPRWKKMAADEIEMLKEILPSEHVIDMQHVGSTAIPNIMAKPIIDIQIAVHSLTKIKPIAIEILQKADYVFWADNPDPERLFFVKGMPPFGKKRSHHVHIVEPSSRHWREKILFRDYLRAHPDAAKQYEQLKRELARQHCFDREYYTEAKTDFIKKILKKAH